MPDTPEEKTPIIADPADGGTPNGEGNDTPTGDTPTTQDDGGSPTTPTIDEVKEIAVEELTDDQKEVIRSNADSLSDEEKETYKDVLAEEKKEDKEEVIDPDKINVDERGSFDSGTPAKTDDDAELDPEQAKIVNNLVQKQVGPVIKAIQAQADEKELTQVLTEFPTFKKYEGAARKYMAHPAWAKVPVKAIFAHLAMPELMKLGAQKAEEAKRKADATRSGGGSSRRQEGSDGLPDFSKMTDAEMEDYQLRAKRGEFLTKK